MARDANIYALAPIQFPIGSEKNFVGVVDLLKEQAYTYPAVGTGAFEAGPIPDELADVKETYRQQLIEALADGDEDLMMRYLEGDEIETAELSKDGESIKVTLNDGYEDGSFIPELLIGEKMKLKMFQEEQINLEDVFMGITKGITN